MAAAEDAYQEKVPYQFQFDSANRILRNRFEGSVTDEELKESYRRATDWFVRVGAHSVISDFSDVTSWEVSPDTVRGLAWSPPALPDASAPRFVVAPSSLLFGMARMFQLYGEETRPALRIVRSLDEAFASLGVSEVDFKPVESENC